MRTPIVISLALLAAVLVGAKARAVDSCGTCHPEAKTEYDQGVHASQFSCTACHGGDPTSATLEAHSNAKGFIGKPSREQIPALCGSCHSDAARMKPFDLPTDQLAQYQTSQHGIRLAQGDTRVAVCIDCHGTHRILRPDEPTSPVNRANVPATCGHCHSNKALMAQYNLPSDQEEKFRRSVHGVALLVQEHPDAPTCATCHGAHGAVAPGMETIGQVCGHCHTQTREQFEQSPHREAARQGKISECVSCHGHHDIAQPTRALFDSVCKNCHSPDSTGIKTAQELKTLLSRAEESLEAATHEMDSVKRTFPTVVQHRPRLEQARAYYIEALTVQHSLSVNRTDDLTRSARSTAEDVRASIYGVGQSRQLRYLFLSLVWLFLLLAVTVAYFYRQEKRRQRKSAEETGPTAADG
jgi:hypothetical protein